MSTSVKPPPSPSLRLFAEPQTDAQPVWWQSTWALACLGSLLLWVALPPIAFGWLGWIAPIPWLILIRKETLTGNRPYLKIYFAGVLFWLLTIHWLRLPHLAVYLGWLALSAYLGVYLPVFIGLSRVAVYRLRWPLWIAAPVVWTGLELAQGHLLTGFLMGTLGHTQVHFTTLIQAADLVGAYGISFLVMLGASGLLSIVPLSTSSSSNYRHWNWRAMLIVYAAFLPTFIYGFYREFSHDARRSNNPPPDPTVALIQGNTLPDWKADEKRQERIMDDQIRLSKRAVEQAKADGKQIDVVIWPETMFRTPLFDLAPDFQPADGVNYSAGASDLRTLAAMLGTPLLVGIDRIELHSPNATAGPKYSAYNSAALVNRAGELLATYDKSHLVMFGEYVPFANWIPWLDTLTPITGSATHGAGPVAFDLDGIRYVPSICYETVIPHVIRRQVRELSTDGKQPDVLVNVTNDAWYWGSSELDQHLACGVFRAIETRTPLVIAANGGLSAIIDGSGRILHQSPRMEEAIIVATVPLDPRTSLYATAGDWFAGACLLACVGLAIVAWRTRGTDTPVRPSDRNAK